MAMSRNQVKSNLIASLSQRFPQRNGNFPESLKIAALGFPTPASLRTFGMQLNNASWYPGWFTPSEFRACVTIGKDRWSRLSEQIFRVDKWSLCRG
jgi:hypothetical protein